MLGHLAEHLLRYRYLHLLWSLLATAFALAALNGLTLNGKTLLPGMQVDNSMEVWFLEGDEDLRRLKEFQSYFSSDEYIVFAFARDDIFQPDVLRKIQDLTEKLYALPYVRKVTSLTNVEEFRAEDDSLEIEDLFASIPADPAQLRAKKARVLSNPLYVNNVISKDGTTTALILYVQPQPAGVNYQRELTDAVYALMDAENENGKYQFHASGSTLLIGEEDRATTDDSATLYLLALILLIVTLYLLHRRLAFVVVPLVILVVAILWSHAAIPLTGSTFNMVLSIMGALVMVIGIADTIHFIAVYNELAHVADNFQRVRRTVETVFMPCLFTSLTTAAGFASMVTSNMKPVAEFGFFAALAMALTFIANVVLVTVFLSFLRPAQPGSRAQKAATTPVFIQRALAGVVQLNQRHPHWNIGISLALFLVSLSGILMIEVNTHEIEYFKKDHRFRVATEFIEDRLTGTFSLEILLKGPEGSFTSPDHLRRMEQLQAYLKEFPEVRDTFSMVDYLKEMHRAMHNEDDGYRQVPDSQELIAQYFLLADDTLADYVDTTTFGVAQIGARMKSIDTDRAEVIFKAVEAKIDTLFAGTDLTVETSGMMPAYIHMNDYIVDSQVRGFGQAAVIIFLMLALLVRSLKLAAVAMIPNLIPVALTMGIMGWSGIYLDFGTVLIGSIALGLAVDDTIHFLSRFKILFAQYGSYDKAIEQTILQIGVPLCTTSIILFFGFASLTLTTFKPNIYFGMMAAITMLTALVADLLVLPPLIRYFKPYGPERTVAAAGAMPVEILAGTNPAQARRQE